MYRHRLFKIRRIVPKWIMGIWNYWIIVVCCALVMLSCTTNSDSPDSETSRTDASKRDAGGTDGIDDYTDMNVDGGSREDSNLPDARLDGDMDGMVAYYGPQQCSSDEDCRDWMDADNWYCGPGYHDPGLPEPNYGCLRGSPDDAGTEDDAEI